MLVEDEGVKKVLLTGTVFPVRGDLTAVPKPRYRLTDKRSSFAVRVVAAAGLPVSPRIARFAPGGSPSRNFLLLLSRSFLLSRGFRNLLDLLCVTPVLMKPVKRKK